MLRIALLAVALTAVDAFTIPSFACPTAPRALTGKLARAWTVCQAPAPVEDSTSDIDGPEGAKVVDEPVPVAEVAAPEEAVDAWPQKDLPAEAIISTPEAPAMGVKGALVKVGDKIPSVMVQAGGEQKGNRQVFPKPAPLSEVLGPGLSILVGMPGAFTPTCDNKHLPGLFAATDKLNALGVNTVAVITTNDKYVNTGWAQSVERCSGNNATGVTMLSDVNAQLIEAIGLQADMGEDLSMRSKRFALIVEDEIIQYVAVDEGRDLLSSTSAEALLRYLDPTYDTGKEISPVAIGAAGVLAAALVAIGGLGGDVVDDSLLPYYDAPEVRALAPDSASETFRDDASAEAAVTAKVDKAARVKAAKAAKAKAEAAERAAKAEAKAAEEAAKKEAADRAIAERLAAREEAAAAKKAAEQAKLEAAAQAASERKAQQEADEAQRAESKAAEMRAREEAESKTAEDAAARLKAKAAAKEEAAQKKVAAKAAAEAAAEAKAAKAAEAEAARVAKAEKAAAAAEAKAIKAAEEKAAKAEKAEAAAKAKLAKAEANAAKAAEKKAAKAAAATPEAAAAPEAAAPAAPAAAAPAVSMPDPSDIMSMLKAAAK